MPKILFRILYRAAQLMILALLVYGFVQTLPLDAAFLMAGDTLLYFEIATAVWLAAQVTRLKWALTYVRLALRPPLRRLRGRARRAARRLVRLTVRQSKDDGRARGALAWA